MKTHLIAIIAVLSLAAFPVSRASEPVIPKTILLIMPSRAASAGYWRDAVVVIDRSMLIPAQHLVCGRVGAWGKYCILCVRAETAGKLTQEAYFKSEDWSDPALKEEPDKFSVVMPSGIVLLEVSKKPNQPSGPTTPSGHGSP